MQEVAGRALGTLLTIAAIVGSIPADAQSISADTKSAVAPTGTLRAGINYNNPLLAKRNPTTGELSGIAVDLSRELGKRLGVAVELVPYDAAGKMGADARNNAWDVAYLAIDPARAADIEFSPAYMQLEGTYLVPAGSPLKQISDVDRPGVRIAVTSKSAYDLYLSRELKHAKIVHADATPLSIDMMVAQKLDAVAAVRTALVTGSARVPGSRVLSGNFMTIPQAAGVPKGRPVAAQYVSEFIEGVKASGFVAAALERHGLGPDDAVIAPATATVFTATYMEVQSSKAAGGVALVARYAAQKNSTAGASAAVALQEIGRPNRLVLVEGWRDHAALSANEGAPRTQALRTKLAGLQISPYDQRVNHGFLVDPNRKAATSGALYVVTHLDVPGPRREEAEVLLRQLFEAGRKDAGLVRYDIYQQLDPRRNHFTIFTVWDNQRAFDAFGRAAHWLKFRASIGPLLGALYDERLYRPIPLAATNAK